MKPYPHEAFILVVVIGRKEANQKKINEMIASCGKHCKGTKKEAEKGVVTEWLEKVSSIHKLKSGKQGEV